MRARERYLQDGPGQLTDADLVRLVLGFGGGGRSASRVAVNVLDQFGGLSGLAQSEPGELLEVVGIGPAQAVRLHAAVVLGQRAARRPVRELQVARTQEEAEDLLVPRLRGLRCEELHAVFLDGRSRLLGWRCLTRGSPGFTIVDPRQIFHIAVRLGASAVVLAHNHPSGDASPSQADLDVTRRIDRAGDMLGIRLLDHLIVGSDGVRSMAGDGVLVDWPARCVIAN